MSSRSLGLLAGFFVSHGSSSPASWRLISCGSSVRKRMRPSSRTLSGRFSIFRSKRESITLSLWACEFRGRPGAALAGPKLLYRHRTNWQFLNLTLVLSRIGQGLQPASLEDFLELVDKSVVHQAV